MGLTKPGTDYQQVSLLATHRARKWFSSSMSEIWYQRTIYSFFRTHTVTINNNNYKTSVEGN